MGEREGEWKLDSHGEGDAQHSVSSDRRDEILGPRVSHECDGPETYLGKGRFMWMGRNYCPTANSGGAPQGPGFPRNPPPEFPHDSLTEKYIY